jgi:hypothetical protein
MHGILFSNVSEHGRKDVRDAIRANAIIEFLLNSSGIIFISSSSFEHGLLLAIVVCDEQTNVIDHCHVTVTPHVKCNGVDFFITLLTKKESVQISVEVPQFKYHPSGMVKKLLIDDRRDSGGIIDHFYQFLKLLINERFPDVERGHLKAHLSTCAKESTRGLDTCIVCNVIENIGRQGHESINFLLLLLLLLSNGKVKTINTAVLVGMEAAVDRFDGVESVLHMVIGC